MQEIPSENLSQIDSNEYDRAMAAVSSAWTNETRRLLIEQHLPLVGCREHRDRGAARIAQIDWPTMPIAHTGRAVDRMQRLEYGMLRQQLACFKTDLEVVDAEIAGVRMRNVYRD